MQDKPSLAVVVPAHQAEAELPLCLEALLADGFAARDVVVVDDGSRDLTGEVARRSGVRVIRNDAPEGPAKARNRGAAQVDADVVLFVDADVVVAPGARSLLLERFGADGGLGAVFGSYDDRPPGPGIVARYRNLLHHHVHQTSDPEASTFWTGLGAVRLIDFQRLGGLRPEWQAIEDVDFGLRLKGAGGRILLEKRLLGTHLKAWTLWSMFRTDLFGRAIPWSRIVLERAGRRDDLNFTNARRASALAALVALFGATLALVTLEPVLLVVPLAAALIFVWAERDFLRFLARTAGPGFALVALPAHALHYLAALAGYAYVRGCRLLRTEPKALRKRSAVPAADGAGAKATPRSDEES
jgi:GT2 family glycosyltransferase